MQIRAANRQDEPIIQALVFQFLEEKGVRTDLQNNEADLRNVEHNYFWYDGLCLVAEEDGQLIGILAARPEKRDEENLLLKRLMVIPGYRRRGVARALLDTALFFASDMSYKRIVLKPPGSPDTIFDTEAETVISRLGFINQPGGDWHLKAKSD